jgi:hypothetical protein
VHLSVVAFLAVFRGPTTWPLNMKSLILFKRALAWATHLASLILPSLSPPLLCITCPMTGEVCDSALRFVHSFSTPLHLGNTIYQRWQSRSQFAESIVTLKVQYYPSLRLSSSWVNASSPDELRSPLCGQSRS